MFSTNINNAGTRPLCDHIWNKIKIKPSAVTKVTKYPLALTNRMTAVSLPMTTPALFVLYENYLKSMYPY